MKSLWPSWKELFQIVEKLLFVVFDTYLPSYLPTFLPTYLPTYLPSYLPTYLQGLDIISIN